MFYLSKETRNKILKLKGFKYVDVEHRGEYVDIRLRNEENFVEITFRQHYVDTGFIRVNCKEFFNALKLFRAGAYIDFVGADLTIYNDSFSFTIHQTLDTLTNVGMSEGLFFEVDAGAFLTALKKADKYLEKTGNYNPALESTFSTFINDNLLELVASDGYRLFKTQLFVTKHQTLVSGNKNLGLRLNKTDIKILKKLIDKTVDKIYVDVNVDRVLLLIGDDEVKYFTLTPTETYPDYHRVIPKQFNTEITLEKDTLEVLKDFDKDVVVVFNLQDQQQLIIKEDAMLTGRNKTLVEFNITPVGFAGKNIRIVFSNKFLQDLLTVIDKDKKLITVKFVDESRPAIFEYNDNEQHVILPILEHK